MELKCTFFNGWANFIQANLKVDSLYFLTIILLQSFDLYMCIVFVCSYSNKRFTSADTDGHSLCTSVHACSCSLLCPVHECPFINAVASFEVDRLYRSLAENTGMAICDTIDTWHVNIDSNSRCDAPCRFALLYLLGFGYRHSSPTPTVDLFL